jgi:hypothetical protein
LRKLSDPTLSDADHAKELHELVELVGNSTNLVLRLMRRGLRLRFWERLQTAGIDPRVPRELLVAMARDLGSALADRDGPRATEITYSMMKVHRERILQTLEAPPPAEEAT